MVINGKRDYDARCSPLTSRPFARPAHARASHRFKSAVLKLPHMNQIGQNLGNNNNGRKEEREDLEGEGEKVKPVLRASKDAGLAFQLRLGGEKHHQKERKRKKRNQNEGY